MIPKALGLVWEAAPRLSIASAAVTVVQAVLPAVALYFSKAIVDGVIHAFQVQTRAETRHVLVLVALWFGVQLFSSSLQTLQQVVSSLQGDLLSNHISVRLMEKAGLLDLSFFENAQFYDKLENARREAGFRPRQMATELFSLLASAVTLVSVLAVVSSLSWWLVLLVVAVSVPSLIYQSKYGSQYFTLITNRAPLQRRLYYLAHLLTTDSPVKELRLFGLHRALLERYRQIFQDYVKYQLTVRENIGFGRIEAFDDAERIVRAAAKAGADKVVTGLPQGYLTPLGRWFQDGQELSIGQWQKLALARAFMRDSELLILDEPTASLDVQSEFEVFRAFAELTAGKMAVLISHRFSTVRMAARIVVIEDG